MAITLPVKLARKLSVRKMRAKGVRQKVLYYYILTRGSDRTSNVHFLLI